ncbi:MAG: hypothetical protein AB7F74_04770 [Parvibaculaceae bacterium]
MRTFLLTLYAACAASAALAASAPAPPPELEAARKALAAAVKAHDLKAIVALSRFPLAFSGYEAPEKITEAEFLSDETQFSSLFYEGGDQIVTCLATGKLEHQDSNPDFPGSPWYIDCDGNEYYFGLAAGKWRFTSYMNVNE